MISVLNELAEEELVSVLTDTKNALTKQYAKLFSLDNVGLTFTKDALRAQEAARKGTGARALRAILERLMLDLMYDLPSREDILEVTINRAVVDGKKSPLIRRKQDKEAA
jgi:ATP-dependent Clp protease ATP-binding subunit ClpX